MRTSQPEPKTAPCRLFLATGMVLVIALCGCLSPKRKLAQRLPEVRHQWQSNVLHQVQLPDRALDWPAAVTYLRQNNLRLRRARNDVTNAQEAVRQVFKDLIPQVSLRAGYNQTIEELPHSTWEDVFYSVNGFFNIPGLVNMNTRYFAARLAQIRAETIYELAEREQTIELYKLILAYNEHEETRAALQAEQRFAEAVRSADEMTGQVLLREIENRDLTLIKERQSLQERAGELLGDRRYRWAFTTNGAPGLNYEADPLPLEDTNRVAQLQMRLVAIELVAAWARLTGIKLQYWPELRIFVSGPPVYQSRGGDETFFDVEQVRLSAEVFWRLDTRGQVGRQLRQTRREQDVQIARIRQESLALIDRIIAAQRILKQLQDEIAELNQLIPVVESVPPTPDFAGIVKAAETRRNLRDQERRLRRELAELNTLFWFVDERKWRHDESTTF